MLEIEGCSIPLGNVIDESLGDLYHVYFNFNFKVDQTCCVEFILFINNGASDTRTGLSDSIYAKGYEREHDGFYPAPPMTPPRNYSMNIAYLVRGPKTDNGKIILKYSASNSIFDPCHPIIRFNDMHCHAERLK